MSIHVVCFLLVLVGDPSAAGTTAIAIHYYKTLNLTKKPYATTLLSLTNEPVQIKSKFIDGTTGETLDEMKDIDTYIDVQGTRVPFTKQNMSDIVKSKITGSVGDSEGGTDSTPPANSNSTGAQDSGFVKLLYFTSTMSLDSEYNLSSPYFAFPDDKSIKGSNLLFTALLDDMCAKQLVGIGVLVRNKNSAPRFVAIYPQSQNEDMGINEGFYLIPLPYAGEVRSCANTTRIAGTKAEDAGRGQLRI